MPKKKEEVVEVEAPKVEVAEEVKEKATKEVVEKPKKATKEPEVVTTKICGHVIKGTVTDGKITTAEGVTYDYKD